MSRVFFDSNVLVYAFSADARSPVAYALLDRGGVVSVQSLNELTNVLLRKQKMTWIEVRRAIDLVLTRCPSIVVLDLDTHRLGVAMAERHTLSVYDGMIVAAALTADCDILYSEDMHAGLVIDGRLTIVNPFAPVA
ncbi:putative nucleic acid-binding protein [Sphingomonas insulae]|uniref:PIN domain-containing protein n=1 Tax=Sphingomonas insulae TaxID=424800 RepID=A0ABN1HYA6_9SPHN|nr:PIN domain-containing protein [Sphingomonas insulae]NIJ29621.1 putative nucleic acid-binding protein [Sphingomonas insulae]